MNIPNSRGKHKWLINVSCFYMLFMFTNSYAVVNAFDKSVNHPPIPLLDEQGGHVTESHKPYSPKKSCAGSGCHDYDAITHAYHFEMGRDEASDSYGATRGLPHLVSPGYYGGYTCMGGSTPQVLAKKENESVTNFADYGSAGWVKTCMTCHTGGGWAEKDRDGIRYDEKNPADIKFGDGDYYERHVMEDGTEHLKLWDWKKSGVGEADCLFCHVDFATMDFPTVISRGRERALDARGLRRRFNAIDSFRSAATGFLSAVLDKDGKKLVSIQLDEEEQIAIDDQGQPIFNWNTEAFDDNGRTTIPMIRFPGNANCMVCHRTSNSRRGFYGMGESSEATLAGAGEDASDGVLEDDYQDDVHKGKTYTDDNGQTRDIENCNSCHSKQYFKSPLLNVDLDANHDFPKGNSDMDVRNDLDFAPNAKSCEDCHIKAKNAVIPSKHETLLKAHLELWKSNGDMAGYSQDTLTQITKTHFDVISCQACHINGKVSRGDPLQIMFRYRTAENGASTMVPYNPRIRSTWRDKVSGRILVRNELRGVRVIVPDEADSTKGYEKILNVMTGEELGRLKVAVSSGHGGSRLRAVGPETYEDFMLLKSAYDILLTKKGYKNPDVAEFLSESNEYIISHNTRPSPDSVQCEECHERKQSGAFSALISTQGIMGRANEKTMLTIPDPKLVTDGHYILDLPYMKVQANGDITQNVEDILFATRIDPFMSLLKNSSASEVTGEFSTIDKASLLTLAGAELGALMAPELPSDQSFFFQINKGDRTLRNMAAAIDGNTVNNILFPTYRGALGFLKGAEGATQEILTARNYGKLQSDVFFFDILDGSKKHVTSFNGALLFIKVAYKGNKTSLSQINVVMADWDLKTIKPISASDLLMISPANEDAEGYVIIKTTEPGYFVISDK